MPGQVRLWLVPRAQVFASDSPPNGSHVWRWSRCRCQPWRPADVAEAYLRQWCYGARRSLLEPVKAFVTTVEAHWDGVLAWQRNRLINGLLEGTSSLVQAAKRRARGYRSKEKMITIIYLIAGKLPLPGIHTI